MLKTTRHGNPEEVIVSENQNVYSLDSVLSRSDVLMTAARSLRQERIKQHDHSSVLHIIVFKKMINVNCSTR